VHPLENGVEGSRSWRALAWGYSTKRKYWAKQTEPDRKDERAEKRGIASRWEVRGELEKNLRKGSVSHARKSGGTKEHLGKEGGGGV